MACVAHLSPSSVDFIPVQLLPLVGCPPKPIPIYGRKSLHVTDHEHIAQGRSFGEIRCRFRHLRSEIEQGRGNRGIKFAFDSSQRSTCISPELGDTPSKTRATLPFSLKAKHDTKNIDRREATRKEQKGWPEIYTTGSARNRRHIGQASCTTEVEI